MNEPSHLSDRARPHWEWAVEHWADYLRPCDAETLALWAESRADGAQARRNLEDGPFVADAANNTLERNPWHPVAIEAERRCTELMQTLGIK